MEAPRGVELTGTNSPCGLFGKNFLPPCQLYFGRHRPGNSLTAMEERVHPIPFRTRKLSSPSPMILHNVMWESRPLPTIAAKPPAAPERGGLLLCPHHAELRALPGSCRCWQRDRRDRNRHGRTRCAGPHRRRHMDAAPLIPPASAGAGRTVRSPSSTRARSGP